MAQPAPSAPSRDAASRPAFRWDDPFLLDEMLSEDERAIRDAARRFCRETLAARVQQDFRNEAGGREVVAAMGAMGLLGTVIEGYGCAGTSHVVYGLIAHEIEYAAER